MRASVARTIVALVPPRGSPSYHLPYCCLSLKSSLFLSSLPLRLFGRPSLRSLESSKGPGTLTSGSVFSLTRASMASSTQNAETKPFSVLFVCLGNICRSPAAEGVFKDIVKKRGLESKFNIDSAGTIGYHEGNPADSRMKKAAKRRGVDITSISRPIRPSDFKDFDLILAMDKRNREDILEAFNVWKSRENIPANANEKVKLMCCYCTKHDDTEVPDPYYGGAQGFEKVLDLLEDACESLTDSILAKNK